MFDTGSPDHRREIRVLLADDHIIVRAGLRALLEKEPGLVVVGEAGSGSEAVAMVKTTRPHVVLMDLAMPGRGSSRPRVASWGSASASRSSCSPHCRRSCSCATRWRQARAVS